MSNYVLTPQAVRKLKTALQGKRGTGGAHMNSSANIYESEYPPPFSVQWAQSVGDSGSWIIWLPGSSLVMWGKDALDITEDLDAASGYPSGWYELPSSKLPASGGTLYLLITPPQKEEESGSASESASEESETGEAEAEFSATAGTDPQISVPICVAATAAGTNEKTVKQLVTSAIVLTDDGGAKKTDVPEPDDISVNFAGEGSESESGTDGGEGESSGTGGGEGEGSGEDSGETEQAKKLQIKNWDNGESDDEANNLADLVSSSDGEPHTDSGNYELIARKTDGEEKVLKYLPLGTLKKTVEKVESTVNAGSVSILFTYTDGTTTEVVLPAARNGRDGAPGAPGDTPEITADKIETTTNIYADGALIAQIEDGHVPNFTAENTNGTVTLYADGVALVSWNEGQGGGGEEMAWDTVTAITGISFKIESGKLKAVLTKTSFNVPNTFELHPVTVEPTNEVEVCNVEEVDVVTSESYSTSTHAFTNERKRVKVLGAQLATGQTPFTATPLSGE